VYVVAVLNNAANAYAPTVALFAVNAASGTVNWKVPVQAARRRAAAAKNAAAAR
jgi:hypothetical protein